jgi:hypothetical protein
MWQLMQHPKEWLHHLDSQRLAALNEWQAEKLKTEKLRVEIGANLDAKNSEGFHRQLIAEIEAEDRHREAQREYVNFLGYVKKNGLF